MKRLFTLGIFIFWGLVATLGTAGLIAYLCTPATVEDVSNDVVQALDEAIRLAALRSGVTTWTPDLVALHATQMTVG
jgi:hypothetical protein